MGRVKGSGEGAGRAGRKKLGRCKRSYVLSGSAVMRSRTGTSPLSALDPLSGQEKWRRLAEGRFGFITLYLRSLQSIIRFDIWLISMRCTESI